MKYLSVVVFLLSTVLTCNGEIDPLKLERVSSTLRRLPQLNVCGLSTTEFGTKIINGRPAKLGSYPWMVAVGYRRSHTRNTYWGCGGSLVTNQHVITAAHCKTVPASQGYDIYELRLGDLNLNDNVADGASPVNVGIEEVILHEKYDNTIKLNDIAIIKMAQRVQFTELIKPICLPPPEFQRNMFVSYAPLAAGWGKTDLNGFVTDTRLMETQLTIQELDECRANVTKVLASVVIDESVICAYTPFTDTCNGDSGGPLMFPRKLRSSPSNSPGNMFLMGIVSYGYKCAQEGYPGVYTRVSHHMEWIVDHLDI